MDEVDLKNNTNKIVEKSVSDKTSASDLANFVFCPVSYSIKKSFVLPQSDNEIRGLKFHEKLLLKEKGWKKEGLNYSDSIFENSLIQDIRNCELVFAGHNEQKHFFLNEANSFIGQPDYIFKDREGDHFVVEEKFQMRVNYLSEYQSLIADKERMLSEQGTWDKNSYGLLDHSFREEKARAIEKGNQMRQFFWDNHKVQLASYIINIQDFSIKYGYLIYWFYDKKNSIFDMSTFKMVLDPDSIELYDKTYANIKEFQESKSIPFYSESINLKKCVKCSATKVCMHKIGKSSSIPYPYDKETIKLFYSQFPETLKK